MNENASANVVLSEIILLCKIMPIQDMHSTSTQLRLLFQLLQMLQLWFDIMNHLSNLNL